jgi:hypothetical protein
VPFYSKVSLLKLLYTLWLGLARTINIRCVYGIFGREFAICTVICGVYIRYTVIYGVYIRYTVICGVYTRFWPTPIMVHGTAISSAHISSLFAVKSVRVLACAIE